MTAVDQAPAEAVVLRRMGVEVDPCRVLVEARRRHVVGLLDRHSVLVVDALAGRIVVPQVGTAGGRAIVTGHIEAVGN